MFCPVLLVNTKLRRGLVTEAPVELLLTTAVVAPGARNATWPEPETVPVHVHSPSYPPGAVLPEPILVEFWKV